MAKQGGPDLRFGNGNRGIRNGPLASGAHECAGEKHHLRQGREASVRNPFPFMKGLLSTKASTRMSNESGKMERKRKEERAGHILCESEHRYERAQCHRKYPKRPERTENTGKDGKGNCLGKSGSFQEMQVEGPLRRNRNMSLSRRQHGFKSRWGGQSY